MPLKKSDPVIRLPPVFGTMFIVRPAVSVSPRPPEVMNVTSCALPTSAMYAGGWLPPGGLPMLRPSIVRRPSLLRPPWIGNCVVAVPVTVSFRLVTTPGHDDDDGVVAAHGRNRLDDVGVQRDLARRALHVDDRRLAGDGDRFPTSVPTLRSALMVAVNEPVSSMPSRLYVLKPVQRER